MDWLCYAGDVMARPAQTRNRRIPDWTHSLCLPDFIEPLGFRSALLSGIQLSSHQPHFFDARAVHNIDRTRNIGEHDAVFTLKECDFLGTYLENVGQAPTERIPSSILLVDSQLPRTKHLHHDRRRRV